MSCLFVLFVVKAAMRGWSAVWLPVAVASSRFVQR